MESVIAIFDIGKKDKKFILLNRDYEVVHNEVAQFEEISDGDNFNCENLEEITRWIKVRFREASKMSQFNIEALNFTTYGASLVNIAENGKPVTPLYNYLKPYPREILKQFLSKYGDKDKLSVQTASPVLGFLNSGLQLFWLKYKKPKLFKQVRYALHFPQYLSYLYTGKAYSEITHIGCHSCLWDFRKDHPHEWVYREKLMHLFPPLINSFNTEKIRFKTKLIDCGIGVHDSSAALIPYQLIFEEPFLLVITGTWNITFNSFSHEPLTSQELSKDCLNYITYRNKPVRASRIYLGREMVHQTEKISVFFRKPANYHLSVRFDPLIVQKLLSKNNPRKKFFPELMEGTGPFPQKFKQVVDLRLFESFEEAYHQLMLDLVSMQVESINLARGSSEIRKLFLAGRFCENQVFVKTLSSRLPNMEIYIPVRGSVTPLGAAITMHWTWNEEKDLKEVLRFTRSLPDPKIKSIDYSFLSYHS